MTPRTRFATRRRRARLGLTLLELLLAIALLGLLLAGVYGFYAQSLDARQRGTNIASRVQLARVVLDQMAAEIRSVTPFVPAEFGVAGIEGDLREITLATLVRPARENFKAVNYETANQVADSDLEFIRYYIALDYENVDSEGRPTVLGLYRDRVRNRAALFAQAQGVATSQSAVVEESVVEDTGGGTDINSYIRTEVVSEEIRYLRVRYGDGSGWVNEWNSSADLLNALQEQMKSAGGGGSAFSGKRVPLAVELTVGFIPDYDLLLGDLSTLGSAGGATAAGGEEGAAAAAANLPTYDAKTSASTADETEPHPDRFTIVVSLPMADRVFGPVTGKMGGTMSKFGGSALQEFMQSKNENLTKFSLDRTKRGSGGQGTQGGRTGPAGPLFGGEE